MFLTHKESFPEASEVKNSLKKDNFAFFSTHRVKSSFCFKITTYYNDFFDILQLVRRMFKIFYWRQELHLDNLLDAHNIYFGCIEKIFEGSEVTEVQFFIKKATFWHTLRFQKTPSISHFFPKFFTFRAI